MKRWQVVMMAMIVACATLGCTGPRRGVQHISINDEQGDEVLRVEQGGRHVWLAPKNTVADLLIKMQLKTQETMKAEIEMRDKKLLGCVAVPVKPVPAPMKEPKPSVKK